MTTETVEPTFKEKQLQAKREAEARKAQEEAEAVAREELMAQRAAKINESFLKNPVTSEPLPSLVSGSYFNKKGKKILSLNGHPMKEVNHCISPVSKEDIEICEYFKKLGHLEIVK